MSFLDLKIEIEGIVGTIAQYSLNPYLTGYTASLKRATEEKDVEMAKASIIKLLEWYEENMDSIMKNQYISNKQDHIKTRDILTKALEAINKGLL